MRDSYRDILLFSLTVEAGGALSYSDWHDTEYTLSDGAIDGALET